VELPNAAKILPTVALQKRRVTQSQNRRQISNHFYIQTLEIHKM